MLKITLGPLDAETAQVIANRRAIEVSDLVSSLIQREAAIEITNWRSTSKPTDTPPTTSTAQSIPQAAAHVSR